MIISDIRYNDLQSKALGLQSALNNNMIDITLAKDLVDIILNLQFDQANTTVPQPIQAPQQILCPKKKLNKIFGSEMFDNQPERKLAEDEMSPYSINKLFIDYLKNTYDITKPFIHRWKPEDKLSEDELKEILNIIKNNIFYESFEEATDAFLASSRKPHILDFDTELVINNFYKQYESIYPNLKSIVDENGPSLEDLFICTLEYDRNTKRLLEQTYLARLDIVLYDSHKGGCFKEDCINWLLKTQGYTKEYLYSKDELNKSTFLSSFYDALSKANANFILRGNQYELVILAYTDCFDHAIALGDKKNIVINKSATLFFRDKIEGHFGPAIHLESNIIVDENAPIVDIRFNCSKTPSDRKTFDLRTVNTD